nr:MAG TPA: hypothetical protein [Caudoviricetes sp.]
MLPTSTVSKAPRQLNQGTFAPFYCIIPGQKVQ